ncbi:hypothetical protein MB901379_01975 [Mycobacterium basiliense]|uniref:Uncharacterized protein n=1 Tax=Mycobacterium basiliense TaxID=2094119 RepID=A0A3S5CZQ1_9MYCO|nr:hypothetical protein MB901379_01975 [Mycobacterium basiliense]
MVEHGNTPGFAKLLDLEMLVFYDGGRERTLAAIEQLLAVTGFRSVGVVPTHSLMHVIEAERVSAVGLWLLRRGVLGVGVAA